MASVHDRHRAMCIRNLSLMPKGKGAAAVLTKVVPGTFDPSTGEVIGTTETTYDCSGIRVNYKNLEYKNTAVEYGDFQLYLCPVLQDGITDTPTPVIDDTILFVGEVYKVVSVVPWNAAGIVCGWKLQMRKG